MVRMPELPTDDLGSRDLVSFFSIRRWRLVLAASAGLLALSVLAWTLIPRREEPRVEMPVLHLSLPYPGASAEDVETQVVKPLEEVLMGLEGMTRLESTALPDVATFLVRFEDETNVDLAAEKVRGRVQSKKADLPAEVKEPQVFAERTDLVPQMLLALTGFASPERISAVARHLKTELMTVEGVAGVDLAGDQKPAVRVGLDPARLAAHGLAPEHIARALQAANARIPGGIFRTTDRETLLQVNQPFRNAEDVASMTLSGRQDAQGATLTVRLSDVADITDSSLTTRVRFLHGTGSGAEPGVALAIRFRGDSDAVTIGEAVRKRVDSLKSGLDPDLKLTVVHDQPRFISNSVNSFSRSLLEGMLLVMLVVTLGMGWRPALVVSTVIPMAAGTAVLGLMLLGFSLEMVSIAGLIMALGLLVDDAVVVTESIQLLRDKGLSPLRAAVLGTARVFHANNGTTAVALVSFLPLFFMGGDIGQFIRGLPVAIMIALATSLLIAQTVTPWLATRLLRIGKDVPSVKDEVPFSRSDDRSESPIEERNPGIAFLRKQYSRWLPSILARPGRTVMAGLLLLAGSLCLFPLIGLQFFPSSDKPLIFVSVTLPKGSSLDRTTGVVRQTLECVQHDPEVIEANATAGSGFPGVAGDRAESGEGAHIGDLMLRLRDGADMAKAATRLRKRLSGIPGVRISVDQLVMGPPVTAPIVVRVFGEDPTTIARAAETVKAQLRNIPGTLNIRDSLTDSVPSTRVEIDADKAMRTGLDPARIGQNLRLLHGEDKITEFRRGDDLVQVVIDPSKQREEGDLGETPIPAPDGRLVPVKQGAKVGLGFGFAQLQRRDGRRLVEIYSDVNPGVLADTVLAQLDPWLKTRHWETGTSYGYGGEEEEIGKSFRNLAIAALGSLILITVLLLWIFDNLTLTILVASMVPFVLLGALPGLALTGNPFGFTAFLGLIALTGVFVNHKIYFVQRMQELRRRGDLLQEAILHAGLDRLRPVVLTALTAVLGLLPLTLFGGPMWGPFGWVNVFGLLVSIPLSLVLLPAFIVLAEQWKGRWRAGRS